MATKIKDKVEISSNHNLDIKCFKCLGSRHIVSRCPNKRVIIMREHEGIESKSEKFKEDEMSPLEHCSYVKYLVDREALVIMIILNVQIEEDNIE